MISELRQRGFNDGNKQAKEAKSNGALSKTIQKNLFVDDKRIAKQFMEEFRVSRKKAFRFAVIYSFGFDDGVIEAIYE